MGEQQIPSGEGESLGDGPYADHPVLSDLSRDVRQRIADQLAQDKKAGAMKALLDGLGGGVRIGELQKIIDGLPRLDEQAQPGNQSQLGKVRPTKLASERIDKATTLTLYRDGTFTTTGMIFTSDPDRLIALSSDIDSMRRKSVTGRGAAAVVTTGLTGAPLSLFAGNNRGVIYVTITGGWSGTKTYTTRNPDDRLLSSIRSLQAAADNLLATPPAAVSESGAGGAPAPQQNSDIATQLKTLAELKATGALSDEEFAAAKARILS